MKKEKIYIAGKISGIEEQAEKTFSFVEKQLVLEGFDVVNPMKLPHNHNKSWESYMKECIAALVYCDIIYPIKGFEDSRGACIELQLAKDLGLKVLQISKIDEKI